ncbi:Lipoyltransferase and lipoate-protein ligase [Fomitiporia mediterranea MF3/22]|uniref:Lipoyltransferase and lipoate-protein ligase n=1 Tax=Fomitiporia mediterranea (strain MF3/22) TaxID=694068 RepID=UPI0004407F2C|nr:Lipoyltransferase and lipoate-protein ligase [Fomitiporia mediterranea MF3/22]EJD01609.1 Lipoyltransferase and lipoate-protein ligase [Fomitiporia mediterranea MF3/22]
MNLKLYRHPLLRNHFTLTQRRYNSSAIHELTAKHSIYISKSTNPYFNLTLEDWLFRNKSHERPLLLLYRDEPCVVIGRNQNPWKEVNLQLAALRRVPFIRRRSGGGTVYHDLGNTNYSVHLPRTSFNRNETAQLVVRAVRSLGVNADVNDRNDVCAEGFKISALTNYFTSTHVFSSCTNNVRFIHISGSAYKIASNRAYHHGTMLISTQLNTLGDLLHTTKETMITKGVASVRSPVQNLQRFDPSITHEGFVNAAVRSFQEAYGIDEEPQFVGDDENIVNIPAICKGMEELKSWDWLYGQTPEFTYTVSRLFDFGEAHAEITSKHGLILSCKISCPRGIPPETCDEINKRLINMRYGFITQFNNDESDDDACWAEEKNTNVSLLRIREIWNWIREETSC